MSATLPPLFDLPEATITITKDQLLAYGQQTAMVAIAVDRASRVPMTMEQALPILCKWSDLVDSEEGPPNLAMAELISAIEAHHGIGAES